MLKGVQLPVPVYRTARQNNHVGVVEDVITCRLDQPGANRNVVLLRQLQQALCARPGGDRFSKRRQLVGRQVANEPVTGNDSFGKQDQPSSLHRSLGHETLHLPKVSSGIGGSAFHLDCRDPKMAFGPLMFTH